MTPSEISVRLQSGIETGDRSAEIFIDPNRYIQHNLSIADGKSAIIALIDSLPVGVMRARPLRSIQDGDMSCVHVDYDLFGPKAGFDIHRFENGLIVEHWDNFEPVLHRANASGRSMFDGPTGNGDISRTAESKATVRRFVEDHLVTGSRKGAESFFRGDQLLQHHPLLSDGAQTFVSYVQQGIGIVAQVSYDQLHMIIGEGELVLSVCEGYRNGVPASFYDLFRLEGNKLAEMWTVTEDVLPTSAWKNSNGKF